MNQISEPRHAAAPPSFTPKQGQYLAYTHAYTLVLGRPPAEADLQRHFRVTPPSVHGMVLLLERSGLIRREQGRARSIVVAGRSAGPANATAKPNSTGQNHCDGVLDRLVDGCGLHFYPFAADPGTAQGLAALRVHLQSTA